MIIQLKKASTKPLVKLNQNDGMPMANEKCTTIGLGWSSEKESGPSTLQEVDVKVVPQTTCKKKFGAGWVDEKTMICAAEKGRILATEVKNLPSSTRHDFVITAHDSSLCYRNPTDSGGPLFSEAFEQYGVVSWGVGWYAREVGYSV